MASNMEMSKLAQTAAKALGLPSLEDAGGGGQNALLPGVSSSQAAPKAEMNESPDNKQIAQLFKLPVGDISLIV